MLIAGTGDQAVKLYNEISGSTELGIQLIGLVDLGGEKTPALPWKIICDVSSFAESFKRFSIDEVLFTEVFKNYNETYQLAQIAIEEGVKVTLAADLFSLGLLKSETSTFASIPLVHFHSAPNESGGIVVKRLIDLGVSSTALVLLSPVMLAIALAIKIDSKGPVFFRQRRVGLNGRTFVLLKFRSMVEGAQRMLPKLKQFNEMSGPVFKMSNDPRITRVGRLIRKYSLDELPQLINVFRGDMSLVGPRPPLPSEVKLYERRFRRRLSMRPGITCTGQVSGRNEIPDFENWMKLDLEYIDNWSLGEDFKLLARTIPAVLSGTGAK